MERGRDNICVIFMMCRGHPNVQLTHETTLEFSPEEILGIRGDCILCIELSTRVHIPNVCDTSQNNKVIVEIIVVPPPWSSSKIQKAEIVCRSLCSLKGYVLRKSTHCDERTLAINCDKSAAKLRVLEQLKDTASDPFTKIYIKVKVDAFDSKTIC